MTSRFTKTQLLEDIEFLERRAYGFGHDELWLCDRFAQQHELVRYAYTNEHNGIMPRDVMDLAAAVRATC